MLLANSLKLHRPALDPLGMTLAEPGFVRPTPRPRPHARPDVRTRRTANGSGSDPDLFVIPPAVRGPGGGDALQAVIDAHASYSRLRRRRQRCVDVLASLGALVWLGAFWPSLEPGRLRALALDLWPVGLLVTLATAAGEWCWYRRRAERLTTAGPSGTGASA